MQSLFEMLRGRVGNWKDGGFACDAYPAIAEILEWSLPTDADKPRFLRLPQLRALETYWFLRLVEGTPHIFELYQKYFASPRLLREAFGLTQDAMRDYVEDHGVEALWERVRTDDQFVKDFKLESLRETLTLAYPSYILALAMGAGKTILIGAIIATEFAMALEYPQGPFVQNALVFAPGKTIIESLRELAEVPYDQILPPRLYKPFASTVKLTFTRDGEKDIPVIPGSSFNLVVTNTEKIRIQKEAIRKADIGALLIPEREDEARAEVANRRLQTIASLPHLAVFSDEAHHTYGQSMETGLKRVRQTVDYLEQKTNLIAVINTTGTPYFERQALKDVVFWYGLSQGIQEGYLKDLAGNIQAYDFEGSAEAYLREVIKTFFADYGDTRLPDGAPAKLAIYFPQTDDLKELRPVIEAALAEIGQPPSLCLVNTSDPELTKEADVAAFNRLNDPGAPHRVILLVNKGTEGWNCPSLFACALARKLKTSNNFVLQASTRCLRQIPGNTQKARVYLSTDNFSILDRQLQETYGESIADLNRAGEETRRARIILRKLDLPPLVVTQIRRHVARKQALSKPLALTMPKIARASKLEKRVYTVAEAQAHSGVLQQVGDAVALEAPEPVYSLHNAAVDLAARYRLDLWAVYDELKRLYGSDPIHQAHLDDLARQIEEQTGGYEVREEKVDVALALVKPEGFARETDASGAAIYTAEIVYPKSREHLIARLAEWKKVAREYGFHYDPYNFDSNPEQHFFEEVLQHLNLTPRDVEDIYFTGALTDPAKTDFFVEYKDVKGKWRRYTPDFVIRKKPGPGKPRGSGRVYIVEVKKEHDRDHADDGEKGRKAMALRKWEALNPDRLRYEIIFTKTDTVASDDLKNIRKFIEDTA